MSDTVDESALDVMQAPGAPVVDAPVAGSSGITRVVYGVGRGQFWFPVASPVVNPGSTVTASITQITFTPSGRIPYAGYARMQISNVVPISGGVVFWLNIDWAIDLPFRINFNVA
ncbi:hypothetical protein ACFQ9Q_27750 [Streptomyces virginiae]|uniref:hypothetical protein n=1 Tax=Streptomyces virginiae TaxID=1961 RepID=UPI0036C3C025